MDFKERIVFELEKDKFIKGTKKFQNYIFKKYGYMNCSNIRAMIINYQLEKYGGLLTTRVKRYTKREKRINNLNACSRKYYRTRG